MSALRFRYPTHMRVFSDRICETDTIKWHRREHESTKFSLSLSLLLALQIFPHSLLACRFSCFSCFSMTTLLHIPFDSIRLNSNVRATLCCCCCWSIIFLLFFVFIFINFLTMFSRLLQLCDNNKNKLLFISKGSSSKNLTHVFKVRQIASLPLSSLLKSPRKQVQGSASHKQFQSGPCAEPEHEPVPSYLWHGADRIPGIKFVSKTKKNWHKRRFDCKFIFIVSRSQFALETWSRYKPQRSLKIFWMMTSAHALPAAPNCWRVANCCACSWWLGRATVLKKTCLKLHSLLIFPPCMCVCVCRYLKFDIASIVQFMANLLSARKTGAVQCNCLSVWLRAQRIYDSLSYWNEYLFAFIIMYSLLWQAQQYSSVAPKWNRDVNNVDYSTPISKAEERSVEVNWLTFDNRSCLCEYANHARPPNTHEHTPALEQSRTTLGGNSSKCDANNLIVSQSWPNQSTLHQWREVSERCLNLVWSHW